MEYESLVKDFTDRMERVRSAQSKLDEELGSAKEWLDCFISDIDLVNSRLRDLQSQSDLKAPALVSTLPQAPEPQLPKEEKASLSGDDLKDQLETMLKATIDALGDKISGRLAMMLKDLKLASGAEKMIKMKQIKEAADAELVDLSKLFLYEEVKSNIETIGIDETETKGIDESLERLRRMRKGKGNKKENH